MSFRKITVKSGDEESTLEVTEEEYLKYYRPWWQLNIIPPLGATSFPLQSHLEMVFSTFRATTTYCGSTHI